MAVKAPKNNVVRSAAFELRSAGEGGDGFTLEGYAAVFDHPTRIDSWEGRFDEVIARNAFASSLHNFTPRLQFNHGRDVATGEVPIGAIQEIREDGHGLFVRARLHDNSRVEPIRQAIESGAIDGMSFRFKVDAESWDESAEVPLRTIRQATVFEVGPVVFPAYAATSVGVRSLMCDLDDVTDRKRLAAQIVRDVFTPDEVLELIAVDGALSGTATNPPDGALSGTAGFTPGERAAWLRSLQLSA